MSAHAELARQSPVESSTSTLSSGSSEEGSLTTPTLSSMSEDAPDSSRGPLHVLSGEDRECRPTVGVRHDDPTCNATSRHPIALISAGSRPASVYFRGGEVNILVHDRWFGELKRKMLADLVACHPDSKGSNRRRRQKSHVTRKATIFKYMQRQFAAWLREQKEWYRTFGLTPPLVIGMTKTSEYLYSRHHDGTLRYVSPLRNKNCKSRIEERLPYLEMKMTAKGGR